MCQAPQATGTEPLTDHHDTRTTLRTWLAADADAGIAWLDAAVAELAAGAPDRRLAMAFADAPRQVGRTLLPPHAPLHAVPLDGWSRDQAARVLLLLARPHDDSFPAALARLFTHADLAEQVCLYQALSLFPSPQRHAARAAEGVRSNMLPVFGAIALNNPYPSDCFDEGAWNQMIVKTIFTGRPLARVIGLERRANPALADMLTDYARERRAAGRAVVPDLWRPTGPFASSDRALHQLQLTLADPDPAQQHAAALALHANQPGRSILRAERPALLHDIEAGRLDWDNHAAAFA